MNFEDVLNNMFLELISLVASIEKFCSIKNVFDEFKTIEVDFSTEEDVFEVNFSRERYVWKEEIHLFC